MWQDPAQRSHPECPSPETRARLLGTKCCSRACLEAITLGIDWPCGWGRGLMSGDQREDGRPDPPVLVRRASHRVSMPLGSAATTAHSLGIQRARGAVQGRAWLLPILAALSRRDGKPWFPEGPFSGMASFPVPLTASFSSPIRAVAYAGEDCAVSHTCWLQDS